MLVSLYFIAIGGLFYKIFIRPIDKPKSDHLFEASFLTRQIVNKKAAKSNV